MADQDMEDSRGGMPPHERPEEGQEKSRAEERYQRNPLGFLMFAFALFWLGIYLLLRNRRIIPDTDQSWAYLAWGFASLGAIELLIRLMVAEWRRSLAWTLFWTTLWTGIGAGLWTGDWDIVGPVVLIAIALALIIGRLVPRRR